MIFRAFVVVICSFLSLAFLTAANAGYSEGACGGTFTGRDGHGFTCATERRPYCDQSTGQCKCLLRKVCGGTYDDTW